ncbi:MAG: hypothetical protein AAB019_00020 [Planctomycetota bacterium]
MKNKIFPCPVCGSAHNSKRLDLSLSRQKEVFDIYRCVCGLGYSNHALNGTPADIYDSLYYEQIRYQVASSRRSYLKHLIPFF